MATDFISQLLPKTQKKVSAFLECAEVAGYGKLRIVEAFRNPTRQAQLYGHGRTKLQCVLAGVSGAYAAPSLAKVTWVTPKRAMHCRRLAVDINITSYPKDHWNKIGAIGEQCGLVWGGRWKCRDYMHFEDKG